MWFGLRTRAASALAVGGTLALGWNAACRANDGAPADSAGGGAVTLAEPVPKVPFTLTATDGTPYHFVEETEGFVTLLFFGYTNCPDVCPVHMANVAAVLDRLPFEASSAIKVVFVTTDPERDTPEHIREWLDQFDPSFVGLTGTPGELVELQRAYRLAPAIREDIDESRYLVSHAAHVLAFTRDDSAHVVFPFGTRQSDWMRELPKLVEAR
ncbi:MAG TPA: SCO family protein [Gemmatimonadales bacterium]|nr:SCO family protein [Gemmatimonadales bacterium]